MEKISTALLIPTVIFVGYLMVKDLKKVVSTFGWGHLFKRELSLQIIVIPVLLGLAAWVAFQDFFVSGLDQSAWLWIFSSVVAFLISMFWLLYLSWLDIYESEKPVFVGLTFIMGCASVALVYPLTDFVRSFDFHWNGGFFNDFAYSVVGIGLVEELVKFLPWFIIFRFTKQIDEPFDYLLYASVSALGFAFIENILYLERTGLTAVYARALYSSVAHMFFSSVIAYGVIWLQQRDHKFGILPFLVFWLLAALFHGFYNFWLISVSYRFEILTFLFFLATIHLWVMMKNNLINLSTFYDPAIKLRSEVFMYRLINLMLVVLVVALLGHNILNRGESTQPFLFKLMTNYTYVFAYIAISFSSFMIIPGYFARISLPSNWWLPRLIAGPDLRQKSLHLTQPAVRHKRSIPQHMFGVDLPIQRRIVFDGDPYWYLSMLEDEPVFLKVIRSTLQGETTFYTIHLLSPKNYDEAKAHYRPEEVTKIGVSGARIMEPA